MFFFVILRGHYHQDFKFVHLLPLSPPPPHLFVNLMEIFDKYTVYYFFFAVFCFFDFFM